MSRFANVSEEELGNLVKENGAKQTQKQPTKAGEHLKVIVKKNRLFSIKTRYRYYMRMYLLVTYSS